MTENKDLPLEDAKTVSFPCLHFSQPVGDLYLGTVPWEKLRQITFFDVRHLIKGESPLNEYLGIQRPLDKKRVAELNRYVNLKDASFPTGIILAVDAECASYDADKLTMTLSNFMDADDPDDRVYFRQIARIIDGQHRIAGLESYEGPSFDLPVTFMVGMDIADQAHVFATVNLAQTKVSPSLAYDLYELAQTRSPQKTCHNIAVALDRTPDSPFFEKIKRLGSATEGRYGETLSQAAFVKALLPYISADPMADRDTLKRGRKLSKENADVLQKYIFRNMFVEDGDLSILDVVWNYFAAVRERWPEAWADSGKGNILNRTSGFRSFMRFLRPAYLDITSPGKVPTANQFLDLFKRTNFADTDFNSRTYSPGSSGEAALYRDLVEKTSVET
jgi:DGQHR domain-containing protein